MWLNPDLAEHLRGVHVADEKLFSVSGRSPQLFEWERYGFRMQVPEGATSGPCDIIVKAIVAGQFEFPEGTELVSAVYAMSATMKLNKPVTLEMQHSVAIIEEQQGRFLSFVRAECNQSNLSYKFNLLECGVFLPGNHYGKVSCDGFSLIGIVIQTVQAAFRYFYPSEYTCMHLFSTKYISTQNCFVLQILESQRRCILFKYFMNRMEETAGL